MANHIILDSNANDITNDDSWYALTLAELPDGIANHHISLSELLHKEEKLDVIIPLADVLEPKGLLVETLKLIENRCSRVGLWCDTSFSDSDLDSLLEATKDKNQTLLHQLDLLVFYMPAFADGRSFSQSKYLRLKGFTGELRIAGSFGLDQIAYLKRSGIDSFSMSDDELSDSVKFAFGALPSAYSGNNVNALPMFKQSS